MVHNYFSTVHQYGSSIESPSLTITCSLEINTPSSSQLSGIETCSYDKYITLPCSHMSPLYPSTHAGQCPVTWSHSCGFLHVEEHVCAHPSLNFPSRQAVNRESSKVPNLIENGTNHNSSQLQLGHRYNCPSQTNARVKYFFHV